MRGIVQKPLLGAESMGDGTSLAEKGNVGYWPMNEGTGGIINDLSGYKNTGTLVADTHWVPGKFGHCLDFDGIGDYSNCGVVANFDVSKPLTYVVWVRGAANQIRDWARVCSSGETGANYGAMLGIYSTSNNRIIFGNNAGWIVTTGSINSDWNQIVGVYDGTNSFSGLKIYINGINQTLGTAGTFSGFSSTSEDFTIGAQIDDGNLENEFTGSIDNVMIYNHALSVAEIGQQFQTPFIESPGQTELLYVGGMARPKMNATLANGSVLLKGVAA